MAAQEVLYHRARYYSAARRRQYNAVMKKNIGPVIRRKYKVIGQAHVHRPYIYTMLTLSIDYASLCLLAALEFFNV